MSEHAIHEIADKIAIECLRDNDNRGIAIFDAVAAALHDERERCAAIAASMNGKRIARAIRSQSD